MTQQPVLTQNEIEFINKLEVIDPELARIRRMLLISPDDIKDCLLEIWENMLLARQWSEAKNDEQQQQMAGEIKIRVTRRTINLEKDFHVTHPRSIYKKIGGLTNK